jgi:hypothetical protein
VRLLLQQLLLLHVLLVLLLVLLVLLVLLLEKVSGRDVLRLLLLLLPICTGVGGNC